MYSRTSDDYDAMSKAGIEVIVHPSFWLGSLRTSVGTFEDYREHVITFETKRRIRSHEGCRENNYLVVSETGDRITSVHIYN
jgi:predicted metal-dependent TIM-barrel fold hydrolase